MYATLRIFAVLAMLSMPATARSMTVFNPDAPEAPEIVELEPGVGTILVTPKVVTCRKVIYRDGVPARATRCTIVFGTSEDN